MIRTLIVDDEKLVRMGLVVTIPWEDYGIRIVGEANNGENALTFIEDNEIDLLITDITMPVMSGIELMRQVKEDYPAIHLVALTCHQDFDYIQECVRIGVIDYIVKNQIDDDKFEVAIKRIVDRIHSGNMTPLSKTKVSETEDAEKLQQIEKEYLRLKKAWSSLGWMMHPHEFEQVKADTKASTIEPSRIKSIFYKAMAEWEILLKTETPVQWADRLESSREWIDYEKWLEEVKLFFRTKVNHTSYSDETVRIIYNVLSYINENLTRDVNQNTIAMKFNISRGYLSKVFKEIMGVNFMNYVTSLRVERAKNLLLNTNEPIYAIADTLGFRDERYFSRLFKETVGMPPTEYRNSKFTS